MDERDSTVAKAPHQYSVRLAGLGGAALLFCASCAHPSPPPSGTAAPVAAQLDDAQVREAMHALRPQFEQCCRMVERSPEMPPADSLIPQPPRVAPTYSIRFEIAADGHVE